MLINYSSLAQICYVLYIYAKANVGHVLVQVINWSLFEYYLLLELDMEI